MSCKQAGTFHRCASQIKAFKSDYSSKKLDLSGSLISIFNKLLGTVAYSIAEI